jgi:hypothetical protein
VPGAQKRQGARTPGATAINLVVHGYNLEATAFASRRVRQRSLHIQKGPRLASQCLPGIPPRFLLSNVGVTVGARPLAIPAGD